MKVGIQAKVPRSQVISRLNSAAGSDKPIVPALWAALALSRISLHRGAHCEVDLSEESMLVFFRALQFLLFSTALEDSRAVRCVFSTTAAAR